MGKFLTANLGQRPDLPAVTSAMQRAQKPYFKASAKMMQGLAWQRVKLEGQLVIDKNGGLTGTSTYIGMMPQRHLGVVVMANRGKCTATAVGRKLLLALAGK
jgi:CubicO group peptidase (beta-lactamase class C family)